MLVINTLPSYTSISNAALGNTVYNQDISHRLYASSHNIVVEISVLENLQNIKIVLFTIKWDKLFCCYNSHEVSLCGGRIYSLYIDATVVPARYVHAFAGHCTK